jgi:hypothetical protein
LVSKIDGYEVKFLDDFLLNSSLIMFWFSWFFYMVYFFSTDHTSYSSESFEDFFHERSPLYSLISMVGTYAQASMVVCFAYNLTFRRDKSIHLQAIAFIITIVLLLSLGQRLALITPLIMFFISLSMFGQGKLANKIVVFTILLLILVSPFAVSLRGMQEGVSGKMNSISSASDFEHSGGVINDSIKSIIERADILNNTVYLKEYIDYYGYVGSKYYTSVLVAPIPKIIYPNKPYLMSDDGTLWGDISVLAWRIKLGESTGSLTAFGGITAYRQAGWIGILLDGLLCGALASFLIMYLSNGGMVGKIFFTLIFISMSIKRVPPSFLELLSSFLPLVVILVFGKFCNLFGRRFSF